MTGHSPILAGIDLGKDTESVVSYAAFFASKMRVSLRLLYVIDYLLTPPSYLAEYIEEEKKREEAEIAAWKTRVEKNGVAAECGVVLGRLHESFLKAVAETSPGLLVIGYKSHVIRPSSSERLIKSLEVPMLVVRGKCAEGASLGAVNIRKILCAVDFSEHSRKAAAAAGGYASLFQADLDAVHVVPSHRIKEKCASWQKLGEGDRGRFEAALDAEAGSAFAVFCGQCGLKKAGEVLHGEPAEIICSTAEERGCDLIVMGARGLSYAERLVIGSTTEAVLKASPCPVLIIH